MAIQTHTHDLTTVLSAVETEKVRRISNGFFTGLNETFSFRNSNNLLDDLETIWKQVQVVKSECIDKVDALLETVASSTTPGMVKIPEDGNVTIDEDGFIGIDVSSLQTKLIGSGTGQNIKTINSESLLISGDADDTNIELVTRVDLDAAIGSLSGNTTTFKDEYTTEIANINRDLSGFRDSLLQIQNQVVGILAEVQQGVGLGTTIGTVESGGPVVCTKSTHQYDTGADIVISPSRSYYRKNISSTPVANTNGNWFDFDCSALNTNGQDYMVVKFDLDMYITNNNLVTGASTNWKFPWKWIGTAPTASEFAEDTHMIVEVRGYYTNGGDTDDNGHWEFFGSRVQCVKIDASAQ